MKLVTLCKDKIKKYGIKVAIGIFMFYLIRDLTLYVAIPYIFLAK